MARGSANVAEVQSDKPKRAPVGPRPAYVLLSDKLPEGVSVLSTTRKAEDALAAIDTGEAAAYVRIMVK